MEDKKLPVVNEYEHLGRRDVLKQWGPPALVGIAMAGLGFGFANGFLVAYGGVNPLIMTIGMPGPG